MRVSLNINKPFEQSNNKAMPNQNFKGVIYTQKTLNNIKDVVFDNDSRTFSFFLSYLKDLKARHLNHPTHDIYISYDPALVKMEGIADTQPIISVHDKEGKLTTYFFVSESATRENGEDVAFMMTLKNADIFTSNAPDSIKAMHKAMGEDLLEYEEF